MNNARLGCHINWLNLKLIKNKIVVHPILNTLRNNYHSSY